MLAVRDLTATRAPERRLLAQADELRGGMEELQASYERLLERGRELDDRVADLDRLNDELRRLDGMKSQLLANVSHELQTPLVSIRGYTEMIVKERLGPVTDEQRKGLELSLRNIDRLISMIDGLLEFSRLEREAGALDLSTFPLAELLEECRETLQPRMDERGIHWSVHMPPPGPTIHGDRAKLGQVLFNLASNAVKFNRDGGHVEIVVDRKDPEHARVQVRDTGRGISQADLDRIFERFYRADVEERDVEGTGLGLAIVRNLLRLHGCTIRAESRPGEGATFTFTLPLAEQNGAGQHGGDEAESGDLRDGPPVERGGSRSGVTREGRKPATGPDPVDPIASGEAVPAPGTQTRRPRLRIIRH
jgi:signal transduction histidine kinase